MNSLVSKTQQDLADVSGRVNARLIKARGLLADGRAWTRARLDEAQQAAADIDGRLAYPIHLVRHQGWLIVLAVLVATSFALAASLRQAPVYRATTTFLLTPADRVISSSNEAVNNSITSLSRTTTLNTFAQVAASQVTAHRALERLGRSPEQFSPVSARAVVLPDTFAIEVSVEMENPALAAELANAIRDETGAMAEQAFPTFQVRPLDQAAPPTAPIRPQPARDGALAAAAGLLLGALAAILIERCGGSETRARAPISLTDADLPPASRSVGGR